MAAAVPFALKYGLPLAAGALGKKLSGPSKIQQSATAGTQQAGQALTAAGQPLLQQGAAMTKGGDEDLGAAGSYYKNILGSRTAANQSLAPEMTTAMNFYRGAEGKANRTLQGGARDMAVAELDRQRVGQLASYLPQARAGAAQGAAQVGQARVGAGTSLTGQGTNALANAGYLQSGLFTQGTQLNQQAGEGGKQWGGMIYDLIAAMQGGKGGGKMLSSGRAPVNPLYGGPSAGPARNY